MPPYRELRKLRGWSVQSLSERCGISVETIQTIEDGNRDPHVEEALMHFYGLDLRAWWNKQFYLSSTSKMGRIFLLHGDIESFNIQDIPVFQEALHFGRIYSSKNTRGFQVRWEMTPIQASGPSNTHSAKQGHRLAHILRQALGIDAKPVEDIRKLIEDRLGIVVVQDRLSTPYLRAGAVLDRDRAAAAIVLQQGQASAGRRVELAHELCHLIFDPIDGRDAVQIAIDEDMGGTSASLREARAKGFAAAFLLPSNGLVQHIGPPRGAASGDPAKLVTEARRIFGTPQQITVNHLKNLGYFSEEDRYRLQNEGEIIPYPETTLPSPGDMPLCLQGEPVDGDEPQFADAAHMRATEYEESWGIVTKQQMQAILAEVQSFQEQGRLMRAGLRLARGIDELLHRGEWRTASYWIDHIDPAMLDPLVSVGFLSYIHGIPELAETFYYQILRERVTNRLQNTDWTTEAIQGALSGL